jgi:hypothetical protein
MGQNRREVRAPVFGRSRIRRFFTCIPDGTSYDCRIFFIWVAYGAYFLANLTSTTLKHGFNCLLKGILILMAIVLSAVGVQLRRHDNAMEVLIPLLRFRWIVAGGP